MNVSAATDPHELKERWLGAALDRAGVDRAHWHPTTGFRENRRTVEAVYNYYGQLFAEHDFLLWAGMASMIGPSFYAAFMDIGLFPDLARQLAAAVCGRLSRRESREVAGELGFYEDLFLSMQKKIFEDQASMHEAYLAGGIPEIKRLYEANIIDLATFAGWQEIHRGRCQQSREALETGCRILLWREQREIIGQFYETMLDRHGLLDGRVFTKLMTLGGAPSIPGAHSQSQVFPLYLTAEIVRRMIRVRTPLPQGNIALFTNRWGLIQQDTLPAYLDYVEHDPAKARQDAETPVSLRAVRFRILARAGAIAGSFVTRWRLSIGAAAAAAGLGTVTTTSGETVVLDLEAPPTADALGLSPADSTHVWLSPGGPGMPVEVRLPGKRVFCARADLVAVTSFEADRALSQIMVTLPPAHHVDEVERRLTQYATDWGIARAAITGWRDGATRVARSTARTHDTQVLGPASVGYVTIEFEVAHHVREQAFHISALFTWQLAADGSQAATDSSTD